MPSLFRWKQEVPLSVRSRLEYIKILKMYIKDIQRIIKTYGEFNVKAKLAFTSLKIEVPRRLFARQRRFRVAAFLQLAVKRTLCRCCK